MSPTFRPSGISVAIRDDLASGASRSGTTLNIDPLITKDANRVTMAQIGDICFAKIDEGTDNEEIISFTGITDNTTYYTLTGVVWGYNFYDTTGSVTVNQKKHNAGATLIITNDDHHLATQFVNVDDAQTISGIKTFSALPAITAGNPVADNDVARKAYVDNVVAGIATTVNVIVPGTAGETVAAGELIYFDDTDNEWKLCDADTASTVENTMLGIAQGAGTNGNAISSGVLLRGLDSNQTGLTAGEIMYASNTAGAIANSAGTKEVTVGFSYSTTQLYFNPRFNQQLTEDQQDALVGTSGTPSTSNKYVTDADTTGTGSVVRSSVTDALGVTINTYTSTGADTWTKPSGAVKILVQVWGAGGSGGAHESGGGDKAGGGGGGGYNEKWFDAADLGATESINVGAGGAAVTPDNLGNAGGNSTFGTSGTLVTGYGGGAGDFGLSDSDGGGGGGPLGAGGSGTSGGAAGAPGAPLAGASPGGDGLYGAAGGNESTNAGGDAYYGGGGGGGLTADTAGAGGTSVVGGNGGAANTAASTNATAGSQPGGGGGAVSGTGNPSSGAGGDGMVVVTTFV